jgi:hypothetical protein
MDLGQYQLQIFVSLLVILTAAFVALICDFLKGNNERLRELTIELKVRREEEQRYAHTLSARIAAPVERAPSAVESPAPAQLDAQPEKRSNSAVARSAAAPQRPAPGPPPMPAPPVSVVEKPAAAREDWGAPLEIPAGFHEGQVLNGLIQKHPPITGLVVSIGVTTSSNTGAVVPEPVTALVRSLIGPDDFACPAGQDEFLLIYPRLNGAAAQRQLSHVARQLWDFQLRTLGTTSILFSWGGVEVASESLDEAVASASERMQQTRRGRKLITMPLRQAV